MKTFESVILGVFIGTFLTVFLISIFTEESKFYTQGVKDTHKEAFEHGLMVKEITKDDEVIYRWRELHDLNYE
jgi:hypothetical protein